MRRGTRKRADTTMWHAVQCQQFFKTGGWQRLFAVRTERPAPAGCNAEVIRQCTRDMAMKSQVERDEKRVAQLIDPHHRRSEANSWLNHVKWRPHLKGFAFPTLLSWIRPQEENDQNRVVVADGEDVPMHEETAEEAEAVELACQITVQAIRRAFIVSQDEETSTDALEVINRREVGLSNNNRPFYGGQKVITIRRYAQRWCKLLRYLWRTADIERRPAYKLTTMQQLALHELREAVYQARGRRISKAERSEMIDRSVTFWISMFDHELRGSNFENGIISGLAVLGADTRNGGWCDAINFTQTLASIVTTLRALVVYRAFRERQAAIERIMYRRGCSAVEAGYDAPSMFEIVRDMAQRFMTLTEYQGMPTPMNRILHQKTFGMKIRYTEKAGGKVFWQGDDILIGRARISIAEIQKVVHGVVGTAQKRLVEELLWYSAGDVDVGAWKARDMPPLDLRTVADNPAQMDPQFSFLEDSRNVWVVDGKSWLFERVGSDMRRFQRFVRNHDNEEELRRGQFVWDEDAIEEYFQAVKRFKEELIVLVHMSGGTPSRAPELTSVQWQNGDQAQMRRGIYIDNGMVDFVPLYHKGFSKSQDTKVVHRFVPQEVGELVVYYLWLVLPFVRLLQQEARQQFVTEAWLWEPQPEEQWCVDDEYDEHAEQEEEAGAEAQYRGRVGSDDGMSSSPSIEGDEDQSAEGQVIARHIRSAPQAEDVDGFYGVGRVSYCMKREMADRLGDGKAIGVMDWRHLVPAVQRQITSSPQVRRTLDSVYENAHPQQRLSTETVRQRVEAEQGGHGWRTREDIYGRDMQESPFAGIAERMLFREVSVDWHRTLGFASAWQTDDAPSDVRGQHRQEQEQMRTRQYERRRNIDIDAAMRQMYGPQAEFRDQQRAIVQDIVGGRPRVMAIMPTGGGKSLLFMLPACAAPSGVTIVIVPKRSLRADLVQRCQKAHIKGGMWFEGQPPPFDMQIVFVTPEAAVGEAFQQFVNAKMATFQLDRIVIDECHTILQSTEEWRPLVLRLREYSSREVQMLYLTATMPPQKQAAFFERMGVDASHTVIHRAITTRTNIAYQVVEYERRAEQQVVEELVAKKRRQYPQGHIIVYCRSRAQVDAMAQATHSFGFHARHSEQKQAQVLQQLKDEPSSVIFATSAFGEGIDAPTIRVVIHIGIVSSLDDYVQQSGRAGRDGVAAEAIVLRYYSVSKDGRQYKERRHDMDAAGMAFVEGTGCRRIAIDEEMDGGQGRRGCHAGEQACDVCRATSPMTGKRRREDAIATPRKRVRGDQMSTSSQQWEADMIEDEVESDGIDVASVDESMVVSQSQQSEYKEWQARQSEEAEMRRVTSHQREREVRQKDMVRQLERHLRQWRDECGFCHRRGRGDGAQHAWRECPHESEGRIISVDDMARWLRSVDIDRFGGCVDCGVPQSICRRWRERTHDGRPIYERKESGRCQYPSTLRDAVAIMSWCSNGTFGTWVEGEMRKSVEVDQQQEGDEGRKQWFGMRRQHDGIECSNMVWAFMEFAGHRVADRSTRMPTNDSPHARVESAVQAPQSSRSSSVTAGSMSSSFPSVDWGSIGRSSSRQREVSTPSTSIVPPVRSSSSSMPPSAPSRIASRRPPRSEEGPSLAAIQEQLQRWKDRCIVCVAVGRRAQHGIDRCPHADARVVAEHAQRWTIGREKMVVEGNVGLCYCCGAPRKICQQKRFKGVAVAFVVGVYHMHRPVWRQWWSIVAAEGQMVEMEAIPQWIGRGNESGCGRLMEAFMWMVQRVEEQP